MPRLTHRSNVIVMIDPGPEALESLRQLTLQLMLISAGVFGVVGGFVSSADKAFQYRAWLAVALIMFAVSALCGYLLHGVMISLVYNRSFDPFNNQLVWLGILQIGLFVLGGGSFTRFVIGNIR